MEPGYLSRRIGERGLISLRDGYWTDAISMVNKGGVLVVGLVRSTASAIVPWSIISIVFSYPKCGYIRILRAAATHNMETACVQPQVVQSFSVSTPCARLCLPGCYIPKVIDARIH